MVKSLHVLENMYLLVTASHSACEIQCSLSFLDVTRMYAAVVSGR